MAIQECVLRRDQTLGALLTFCLAISLPASAATPGDEEWQPGAQPPAPRAQQQPERASAATPATRQPALPREARQLRNEALRQLAELRRELEAFAQEVGARDQEDRWNKLLHHKLGDALGRLWSARRDLEKLFKAEPLEADHLVAALEGWQPQVDRISRLSGRLRQWDGERASRRPAGSQEVREAVPLPPGTGTLTGRVTDALTGLGIAASVYLYDAAGDPLDQVSADESGAYVFSPVAAGSYYVVAFAFDYVPEVYDDVPCPGSCTVTNGQAIPVPAGGVVTSIDFILDRGGAVSGRVVGVDSGLGVHIALVWVYDMAGDFAASASTDLDGRFFVDGLSPGTYHAVARGWGLSPYLAQLYDGLPCPEATCDPVGGTPIAAVKNTVTTGIDFALPRGGQVLGQVTDGVSGTPLSGVTVEISDASGGWAAPGQTDASGEYTSGVALETGTYYAVARREPPHLGALYSNLPCFDDSCDPLSGTPIGVVAGLKTTGVDFGLVRGGIVSGRVTDATSSVGIRSEVWLYGSAGEHREWTSADGAGYYEIHGLLPGDYFAVARQPAAPNLGELYDDLPCYDGSCDPTIGTPISVVPATATAGIDFALPRGGSVSGNVTDAATSEPVKDASVQVIDAAARSVGLVSSDALGRYVVSGLAPGSVFLRIQYAGPYWPQLYDDLPCPSGYCDATVGTPVPVTVDGSTPGIDFALETVNQWPSEFYTVAPCRAVDTRNADGPALEAGTERVFDLGGWAGDCSYLGNGSALSVNVAVVGAEAPGQLRLYAAGSPAPNTSTISYAAGTTRSNNAVVSLNAQGELVVYVGQASGTVHLIIDVNGYFR